MTLREWQRKQRVMQLGDRFLSYVDEGGGRPIVLVHGMPTWGFVWEPLVSRLARDHRVLVPDLLGFGCSDRGEGFDRSIVRQAEALDAWLDGLAVDRAVVVGHEIGGGVALHLAAHFRRRVGRLVLLDSVGYDSWPSEPLRQLGHPRAWRRPSPRTVCALLRQLLRRGFARAPSRELLDGLLAPYATDVGMRSLARDAAALDPNLTLELSPLLPHLLVPSLVLWGADDPFQPLRIGERFAWDLPLAKLVVVPGARHFAMIERPDAVERALREFLAEEEARPPSEARATTH